MLPVDERSPAPKNAVTAHRADALVAGVRVGSARAIGRAISEVERDSEAGRRVVAALATAVGRAHRIGITGPPARESRRSWAVSFTRTDAAGSG